MRTFNNNLPYSLDIQVVKGDSLTFLDEQIVIWSNKKCGVGFDLSPFDGVLIIKKRPNDNSLLEVSTSSGEMVFTGNVITFPRTPLNLKVDKYFYSIKLVDKSDTSIIGTLFEGRLNVIN